MSYIIKAVTVESVTIRYAIPSTDISSIFFLGLGQRGKNLEWIADNAPEGMIIVEGINYLKKRTSHDMKQLGVSTARYFLEHFDSYELDVYAESQAVPAVLAACMSIQPKKIGLLSPLGLNASNLNSMSFIARCLRVWIHPHQNIFNKANRHTLRHILKDVIQRPIRVFGAYGFASKSDVVRELQWLGAHGTTISIMVGENDQIFPIKELQPQLANMRSVKLKTWKRTGHVNRATNRGMTQLREIHQLVSGIR